MMEEMLKDTEGELSVPNMVEYVTRSIFDVNDSLIVGCEYEIY